MVEFRKVIKFGGNSAIISLPKKWMTHNNISPGDSLQVEVFAHNLLISPSTGEDTKEFEKTISYNISDDELITVKRKIMTAYIDNYDLIILESAHISQHARAIRDILHQFMALEIIEESHTRIVAKCFLNMNDIDIKNLLHKTDSIIKTMLLDVISMTKNPEAFKEIDISLNICERDIDVNRMTALVFRAIKYHLLNPATKKQMGEGFILNEWNLAHTLETIGDSIKRLSRIVNKLGVQQLRGLLKLLVLHQEHYHSVMTAYFKHDITAAHALELKNHELVTMAESYQIAFENSVQVTQAVQKLLDLSKRIKEITFLV